MFLQPFAPTKVTSTFLTNKYIIERLFKKITISEQVTVYVAHVYPFKNAKSNPALSALDHCVRFLLLPFFCAFFWPSTASALILDMFVK